MTSRKSRRSGDEPALGGPKAKHQDIQLGGEAAHLHLIEMLDHDDSVIRERALFRLTELGDLRAVESLLNLMHDRLTPFSARSRAAKALWVNFEDKRGLDDLLSVSLHDGQEVNRREANQALADIGDAAMEPLIAALSVERWSMRAHAAAALAEFRDERTVAPLIAAFGSDIPVNREIQHALVCIGLPAVEPLLVLVKRREKAWGWAIMTLGEIGDVRASETLMELIPTQNTATHRQVVLALGKIGDRRATQLLINTLEYPDASMRLNTIQALTWLRDPESIEALARMLHDSHSSVRQGAVRALNVFGEQATEHLIPILANGPSDTMRVMTASALGSIGDPKAIEPLIAILKDEALIVRRDAVRALGNIGAKNTEAARIVIRPICEALGDTNSIVQRSAASALAEIGQEYPDLAAEAVPMLLSSLKHNRQAALQRDIIHALGKICDQRAAEPLIECYLTRRAPIGEITSWAAWALGEIGDECAVEPLTVLLNSDCHLGARSAAEALGKIGGEQATCSLIAQLERYGRPVSKRALALSVEMAERWFRQGYQDWDEEDLEALTLKTVIEALEIISTPEALAAFNE